MKEALETITNQSFIGAILLTIVLITIGFIFVKKGIIDSKASKAINTIVMKIAFPCLAFCGFLSSYNNQQIGVLICSFIIYVILFALGRIIFIFANKEIKDIYRIIFAMGQVSLFGLPLVQTIYGNDILASTNMILFSFRVFLYVYSFILISKVGFSKDSLKTSLKNIFLNPVIIGMLLGIFVWATQGIMYKVNIDGEAYSILRIDKTLPAVYKVLNTIGSLTTPLGMLLVGMVLGEIDLKSAFTNKKAYILSFCRSFIAPIVTILVCLLWQLIFKEGSMFHFSKEILSTLAICFCSPCSVAINTYCIAYNNEPLLMSDCILMSTFMSIISVPILVFLISIIF